MVAIACLLFPTDSDAESLEYNVKAAFIFHFINFTRWPDHQNNKETRNICIYGDDSFEARLQILANANLQNKPVEIFPDIGLENSAECHIIFVDSSKKEHLTEIISYLHNKPILTVSDIDSFALNKGMIGFRIKSGKVKLEVNLESVRKSGIRLSSNLIEVARVITTSPAEGH